MVNASNELGATHLVIKPSKGVEIHAYPVKRKQSQATPAPPASNYDETWGMLPFEGGDGAFALPDFGVLGDTSSAKANTVFVVVTNTANETMKGTLDTYAVVPPHAIARSNKKGKPKGTRYTVTYESSIPPEYVTGFKAVQKGKTIMSAKPTQTKMSFLDSGKSRFHWPLSEIVWVFLHTVDKHGFESRQSKKVTFGFKDTRKRLVPLK